MKNLPPSILGKKKDAVDQMLEASRNARPFQASKARYTAPSPQFMGESEAATNRRHAASVELQEQIRARRPAIGVNSISNRQSARDGVNRSGSIADRGPAKKGRGYYHPERIRERALRRDEQWQQQNLRRRAMGR